jgi:hypothetical protein
MCRLIEEWDVKKLVNSNVHVSSCSCTVNFAQTNPQPSGTSAGGASQPNPSAQPRNHFYSRTTTPTCGILQQTMTIMFGQGYTHAAPSFLMLNLGSTSYTPRCNDWSYANINDNYHVLYTTVAYTEPIPLPDGSVGPWLNDTNNNTMWYNTHGMSENRVYGYETLPQFSFRPQPDEMTPARVTIKPCADPNNLTTQLTTILRESFGIEPKGGGVYIKNLTPTTTTNSLTLEDIEFPTTPNLMGRMAKPHLSMLANLFYNVVRLVLMMFWN